MIGYSGNGWPIGSSDRAASEGIPGGDQAGLERPRADQESYSGLPDYFGPRDYFAARLFGPARGRLGLGWKSNMCAVRSVGNVRTLVLKVRTASM